VADCESVDAVAAETVVPLSTLFRCKRRASIDAGVIEGIRCVEADQLSAARKARRPRVSHWLRCRLPTNAAPARCRQFGTL
jgi:hypothetical protein